MARREHVGDGPWAPRTVAQASSSVSKSRKLVLTPPAIAYTQHGTELARYRTGGKTGRHWAELPSCLGGADVSVGESNTLTNPVM